MDYFDKRTEPDIDIESCKANYAAGTDKNAVTYGLNTIYFDFKKGIFEINGKSIASCSDIEITCHSGEWNVSITEKGTFNSFGAFKTKTKPLP